MIRIIINLVLWPRTFDIDWQAVTNVGTVSAAFLTLWVALITYRISKSSKVIALESKQIAAESRELAEKAYNLEHEEPWKLTPIADKAGYWILERVHRKFATLYACWTWTNPEWEIVNEEESIRWDERLEVKFIDHGEGSKKIFFRGTKVIVKIPEVPMGSVLYLYYYEHSSKEEANQKKNYKDWVKTNREIEASGSIKWEMPLY